jgi:hypothetical protein
MSRDILTPELVAALAQVAGIPLADEAMAARIATGAGVAIAAVRSQSGGTLFDLEPGDYLATLERLAVPGPPRPEPG